MLYRNLPPANQRLPFSSHRIVCPLMPRLRIPSIKSRSPPSIRTRLILPPLFVVFGNLICEHLAPHSLSSGALCLYRVWAFIQPRAFAQLHTTEKNFISFLLKLSMSALQSNAACMLVEAHQYAHHRTQARCLSNIFCDQLSCAERVGLSVYPQPKPYNESKSLLQKNLEA